MKKIILFPFCFLYLFCYNQIKINVGKDIDIISPSKCFDDQGTEQNVEDIIKNNTDNTYIIDPIGFYGESYVLENGIVLEPSLYIRGGYYYRKDEELCRKDLIILKPYETIKHSLTYNRNNRGVYNFVKSHKYVQIIKSFHNKYYATILGCKSYIKELESKGYKVLEDSINAKIPIEP